MTAIPIVTAVDLHRRFGEGEAAVDALDGVTLELPAGAFTAIMGPSGSGKSTLMHVLAGLDKPTSGTVTIDGVDLSTLDDKKLTELRRDKVGFIFQSFNLLPVLTAQENIELPLKIAGRDVDAAWRDQIVQTVAHRRPPHAPPVRAVRRPAAARRGGACADLQARRRVRRRADRQPRLAVER